MRGKLVSRPHAAVMREAETLVAAGVRELLVISQDTSAYGTDWTGRADKAPITALARDLGRLGAWVRLHYVYPYPHVADLVPLMAEGGILPYLDVPFQHAHPDTLRRMARPAAAERTLERIAQWRAICPAIALRSTFIVGYPGETEAEFQTLLDWLEAAQMDRVGAFQYEDVDAARERAARPCPRRGKGRPPPPLHGPRASQFGGEAGRAGGPAPAGHRGRGRRRGRDLPDHGRCARDRRQPVHRCRPPAAFPGDIVTVEVDEAGDYDLWGRLA